jgi:DNA-binding response OmpR family regulator
MERLAILVVEDDYDISHLLQYILRDHKIDIIPTNSIYEAEEVLTWLNPTHIILDIFLSDGNGAEWIKSKKDKLKSEIILITGSIEESETEFNGFHVITKPFLANSLLKIIQLTRELT